MPVNEVLGILRKVAEAVEGRGIRIYYLHAIRIAGKLGLRNKRVRKEELFSRLIRV